MPKVVLDDLANLQNEATAVSTINNNNQKIEDALENTLSRDGTTPNMMMAELDMNSFRIINLPPPAAPTDPIRLQDVYDGEIESVVVTHEEFITHTENVTNVENVVNTENVTNVTNVTEIGQYADYTFKSKAEATASNIPVSVTSIVVSGYSAPDVPAKYTPVGSAPAHSGWLQSADGRYWTIDVQDLYPEFFGVCGQGNATQDTSAWAALTAFVQNTAWGAYTIRGKLGASYKINGSQNAFSNKAEINCFFHGVTFRQQIGENAVTSPYGQKTFSFTSCTKVKVYGGTFYGKAAIDIANGVTPSEFISGGQTGTPVAGSSSYNGVAACYFKTCASVICEDVTGYLHCGGFIHCQDVTYAWVNRCYSQGIGPAYIQPVDNSGDIPFCFINVVANQTDWNNSYTITNCRTFDHCFGAQIAMAKSLVFTNNFVGPVPGQHGVYGIEIDDLMISNNNFVNCYQFAAKMQIENYAGMFFGSAWVNGATYAPGQEARSNNTLYTKFTATSVTTVAPHLDPSNWYVSDKMKRKGGFFSNNTARSCGYGFGTVETTDVLGKEGYFDGLTFSNNFVYQPMNDAYVLQRIKNMNFTNNYATSVSGYGIIGKNLTGFMTNNTIYGATYDGINIGMAGDMDVTNNRIIQTAQTGSGAQTPFVFGGVNGAQTWPSYDSTPRLNFDLNRIQFISGDAPGYLGITDTPVSIDAFSNRTNSSKAVRVLGTTISNTNNQFTIV